MSLTDLSSFREERKATDGWQPTPLAPRRNQRILALDQSLANTGWVIIERDGTVSRSGNIKTESTKTGHEANLSRGVDVYQRVIHLLDDLNLDEVAVDLMVHETPPVGGAGMSRPESSLLAALAVRLVAEFYEVPVEMVGAQKAKKRFTGNGNAKKKELREALLDLEPALTLLKPRNEAIYDAIGIGWWACEQEGST